VLLQLSNSLLDNSTIAIARLSWSHASGEEEVRIPAQREGWEGCGERTSEELRGRA
jgi:hypothetical protein